MANYIQFALPDDQVLLVEVAEGEVTSSARGIQRAGLKEIVSKQVAEARTSFEEAIQKAIRYNAEAFIQALQGLSEKPAEAEMNFALKFTGELGNIAVGQIGSEVNYEIKLTWKQDTGDTASDGH